MIVDTHVHPLAADPVRYPFAAGRGAEPDWSTTTRLTAEDCLAQMALAGVDQMVLVSSFTAYEYDNSYCADAAASRPDRFAGSCRIDPLAPGAPDSLSSWVDGRGMRGVRIGTADPRAYATCERAGQLGVPVAIQVTRGELSQVRELAERLPDVQFILDHLAHPPVESGPPYAEAAEFYALADCPNLNFKFSTLNIREAGTGHSTSRAFIEALVDRFGPGRLMWGSDFPHSTGSPAAPYKELVDLARETLAFLSPADREEMLAGTARRLYPTLVT